MIPNYILHTLGVVKADLYFDIFPSAYERTVATIEVVVPQTAGRRHRAVGRVVVVAHEAHVAGAGRRRRRRLGRRVLRRRQRHHQLRRVAAAPLAPPLRHRRPRDTPTRRHLPSCMPSKTVITRFNFNDLDIRF